MAKKGQSRGRDLKHTETQAGIDVSRMVSGERGRTNGREAIGAISAVSPKLPRKTASLKRSPNLTRADLEKIPPHAAVFGTKSGAAKIAVWIDPTRRK